MKMNPLTKTKIWSRLFWLVPLFAWFAGSPALLQTTFAYDRNQIDCGCDGESTGVALSYDQLAVLTKGESADCGVCQRSSAVVLGEFLAAKTGATAAEDVTYLYQKVGAQGEHLKFGITQNPATRYTQEELGGGQLRILTEGPRKDMLQLERNLHETLPIGPEERQLFYIQKQVEKGLKPPPYNP